MGTNERSRITMTEDEVTTYIEQSRTCTMATNGPSGHPHLVAMWYAVVDGQIWFETKAKSQKVANLRRDDRITVSIEDGLTYDTLRGVALEGHATVVDDPDDGGEAAFCYARVLEAPTCRWSTTASPRCGRSASAHRSWSAGSFRMPTTRCSGPWVLLGCSRRPTTTSASSWRSWPISRWLAASDRAHCDLEHPQRSGGRFCIAVVAASAGSMRRGAADRTPRSPRGCACART